MPARSIDESSNGDLDTLINDTRSTDALKLSDEKEAAAVIQAFRARAGSSPWTSLDRQSVADRLLEIIKQPRGLLQEGLNLCGPAAFFQMAAGRDPVGVASFATALFESGEGQLGELSVAPSEELLTADYAAMGERGALPPQADWMLLGALRNSMNVFWQPSWKGDPEQTVAGMTRPEELAGWMEKSGLWNGVKDDGKWAANRGIPHALSLTMAPGTDIAFLININMLADSKTTFIQSIRHNSFLQSFPNHWVVLLAEPVLDEKEENVTLNVWTWGLTGRAVVPVQIFIENYYGSVSGEMR
jgi:hypothetical protein